VRDGARLFIWLSTLVVIIGWAAAIGAVHRLFLRARIHDTGLSLALSLAIVQCVCIVVMLTALMAMKAIRARRAARSAELRIRIAESLASDVAGQDRLRALRGYLAASKRDVEREISAMAGTLRGPSRERVLKLGRELGVTGPESAERLDEMFARASYGSLLERAVAAEELEPDAQRLAEVHIPRALRSDDASQVLAALEMLHAWKRSLPVPEVESVLHHESAHVRAAALRALPYSGAGACETSVRQALRDSDPQVRQAAAETARKLRLDAVTDGLVENLSDPDRSAALAAAFALAVMPEGTDRLQRVVASDERSAAAVAFEALEKAAIGRLHLS
jgi:hypothetical protein